jgi:hypothetical protein
MGEDRIQGLLDREAIRDLVFCYSRAVDRQDFAFLRSLYAPDAMEDDHGGHYSGPAEGYVDWLMTVMPRLGITTHGVQNHLVVLTGLDTAEGEVSVTAYHRMPAEGGGWTDLVHGMRYLDHYRKWDGRWVFARRTVILDWKQVGPCCWNPSSPDLEGVALGSHDAADTSYRVLRHPLFSRKE